MVRAMESPEKRDHMIQPMPEVHPRIEAEQDQYSRCGFGQIQAVEETKFVAGAPGYERSDSGKGNAPIQQRQREVAGSVAPARSRACELAKMWKRGLRNPQQHNADGDGKWLSILHTRKIRTTSRGVQPIAENAIAKSATIVDRIHRLESTSRLGTAPCAIVANNGIAGAYLADLLQFVYKPKLE